MTETGLKTYHFKIPCEFCPLCPPGVKYMVKAAFYCAYCDKWHGKEEESSDGRNESSL